MDLAIPAGISSILALILPMIIHKINLYVDNKKKRYAISLAISGILGTLVTVITGNFNLDSIFISITAAATVSQTIYATYWRDKIIELRAAFKAEKS